MRQRATETQTNRDDNVKTEAEMGVTQLCAQIARLPDCWQLPEARRRVRTDNPPEPGEGQHGPADTLISGLQNSKRRYFCCSETPSLGVLCSPRKLIQPRSLRGMFSITKERMAP